MQPHREAVGQFTTGLQHNRRSRCSFQFPDILSSYIHDITAFVTESTIRHSSTTRSARTARTAQDVSVVTSGSKADTVGRELTGGKAPRLHQHTIETCVGQKRGGCQRKRRRGNRWRWETGSRRGSTRAGECSASSGRREQGCW